MAVSTTEVDTTFVEEQSVASYLRVSSGNKVFTVTGILLSPKSYRDIELLAGFNS